MYDFLMNLISFLKSTSPITVIFNLVLGLALLIIGLFTMVRNENNIKSKKILSISCLTIAALALASSFFNWLFSNFIF